MIDRARVERAIVGALVGALIPVLLFDAHLLSIAGIQSPELLLVVMAIVGAVATRVRWAWLSLIGIASALLLLTAIVAMTGLTDLLESRWVRDEVAPSGPVDAVFVFSAGVTRRGVLDTYGSDRTLMALELAKRYQARYLVTTRVTDHGRVSDADQQRLLTLVAPKSHWLVVDSAMSSVSESRRAATLFRQAGITRVIAVTSPLHTRRACGTLEKATGLHVTCVAARERSTTGMMRWRLDHFGAYIYERIGTLKYRWDGAL